MFVFEGFPCFFDFFEGFWVVFGAFPLRFPWCFFKDVGSVLGILSKDEPRKITATWQTNSCCKQRNRSSLFQQAKHFNKSQQTKQNKPDQNKTKRTNKTKTKRTKLISTKQNRTTKLRIKENPTYLTSSSQKKPIQTYLNLNQTKIICKSKETNTNLP